MEIYIEIVPVADIPSEVKEFLYTHLYEPWGVDYGIDWLSADDGGEFLIARDTDERLVGTVRVMPSDDGSPGHPTPPECEGEIRLRQVAVDPDLRGHGIGRTLMQVAESIVSMRGFTRVGVASREQAYAFYRACGYDFFGDEYISQLTYVPHTHMSKVIPASKEASLQK